MCGFHYHTLGECTCLIKVSLDDVHVTSDGFEVVIRLFRDQVTCAQYVLDLPRYLLQEEGKGRDGERERGREGERERGREGERERGREGERGERERGREGERERGREGERGERVHLLSRAPAT